VEWLGEAWDYIAKYGLAETVGGTVQSIRDSFRRFGGWLFRMKR
jgi:hypothetical protein